MRGYGRNLLSQFNILDDAIVHFPFLALRIWKFVQITVASAELACVCILIPSNHTYPVLSIVKHTCGRGLED